jgi:polysaccharide export outer membrane protein
MKKLLYICFGFSGLASLLAADSSTSNPAAAQMHPPGQAIVSADYVLAPSDLIQVQVYGEDALTREVRITLEGTIYLPLVGNIDLKGMTLRQAENRIRDLYAKDYLVNPQVNLMVKEYSKRSVNVLGAVNHPGPVLFPLEQGLTLVDAIADAGGMAAVADLKNVKITRNSPTGGTETILINFKELIDANKGTDHGAQKKDVPLMVDDIINVPEFFLVR